MADRSGFVFYESEEKLKHFGKGSSGYGFFSCEPASPEPLAPGNAFRSRSRLPIFRPTPPSALCRPVQRERELSGLE